MIYFDIYIYMFLHMSTIKKKVNESLQKDDA